MTLFDRAMATGQTGAPEIAYALLVGAIREEPENAEAWYRLGCALAEVKRHEAAVGCLVRANLLRPDHARTLLNLGWELHLCGRDEEGVPQLVESLAYDSRLALAWTDLSAINIGHRHKSVAASSIEMARRAVELEPHIALHHVQLAMALFHAGKWAEGFKEFEWRMAWKMPETLRYPYPLWRGEKLGTLFLQAEQGLGDSLMALRWIEAIEGHPNRPERLIIYVQPELRRFFAERLSARIPLPEIEAIPHPLPAADAWSPFLSLPVALEWSPPELWGTSELIDVVSWQERNHPDPADSQNRQIRIGIAWAGNPAHENAELRDIPLGAFLRLAEIPGVSLHSFQVGDRQKDLDGLGAHALVEDLSPRLRDMRDSADALAGMDLVICCDTALGHLAGVLGKPCWLAVNQRACDWRWGMTEERSVWYPGHRIWRKGRDEPWEAVIERMMEELRE